MSRRIVLSTAWLALVTTVTRADDSWAGLEVVKAKPTVVADRDGDKKVTFEVKGTLIPVLKDQGGRLRVRDYAGQEGWADKAHFVRVADAPAFFTDVIRANEKNAWAWTNRGTAWSLNNQLDKAIEDYTRAIELAPKFASAYAARGGVWGSKGEFDKAIRDFDEAIRIDPNCHPMGPARLYNARGNMWGARKEFDNAIRDYGEAIRHEPDYYLYYCHRGNAWFEKKEYDRAIRDYDEAIRRGLKDTRLDRVDPTTYLNRGDAWRATKEYAKALRDYDETIRLDPKYAMAFHKKAYLLATCAEDTVRDVARAAEVMKVVIELRPESPLNDELLGVIAAAQGKFDDAIRHQKKALEDKRYAERRGTEGRARLAAYEERKPLRE